MLSNRGSVPFRASLFTGNKMRRFCDIRRVLGGGCERSLRPRAAFRCHWRRRGAAWCPAPPSTGWRRPGQAHHSETKQTPFACSSVKTIGNNNVSFDVFVLLAPPDTFSFNTLHSVSNTTHFGRLIAIQINRIPIDSNMCSDLLIN